MFKWLKNKISNLYNHYKEWKRRHPVITGSVAIGVVTFATSFTATRILIGMVIPILIPPSMALFALTCVFGMWYVYMVKRVEQMNQEVFMNARLAVA